MKHLDQGLKTRQVSLAWSDIILMWSAADAEERGGHYGWTMMVPGTCHSLASSRKSKHRGGDNGDHDVAASCQMEMQNHMLEPDELVSENRWPWFA